MGIEQTFPEDPSLPSIYQQAANNMEITMPWSSEKVVLGTGYLLSQNNGGPMQKESAFTRASYRFEMMLEDGSSASYKETSSSSACSSAEHLSVGMGASVGGSWLGASVSGTYDKAALENSDVCFLCLQMM